MRIWTSRATFYIKYYVHFLTAAFKKIDASTITISNQQEITEISYTPPT